MDRRRFLQHTALLSGALLAGTAGRSAAAQARLHWTRAPRGRLFTGVSADGEPFVRPAAAGLFDGECRLWGEAPPTAIRLGAAQPAATHGPLRLKLRHDLRPSGGRHGEDLLEATLTVRNTSAQAQQIEVAFVCGAQPAADPQTQELYLPLNAAGLSADKRFLALGGKEFLKDCRVRLGPEAFACHYLEPLASHPDELTSRALLLAPVVSIEPTGQPWRVALFTASDVPARFGTAGGEAGRSWRIGRVVTVPAGGQFTQRAWLLLHTGDATVAWRAFHRFGHRELHAPIGWVRDFRVHYYDFLSSAKGRDGHRGDGYDADLGHFREFRVGLATQHGYYPCMGDHLRPQRTRWLAMQGDKHGPVEMSLEKIAARIRATRAAGARAGIYMHLSAWDDSSREAYPGLVGGRRVNAEGQPVEFGWNGPDVKGRLWWMSLASPQWRAHLLEQASWILELLRPDAICMDESFSGLGYDYAGGKPEPLSGYAIGFFQQLHARVRAAGREVALLSSDCSMAGFALWADGDVGDHAYGNSLGNPLYTQEPVRYLAVLGEKPWRPCAWHWQGMWPHQMRLARQVGAGVGVSNGWGEFTGLGGLRGPAREACLRDIASLH